VLIDTSTLLRTLQPSHPQWEIARTAIKALTARGQELHIVPQKLFDGRLLVSALILAYAAAKSRKLGVSYSE
jgi:hypothetical protein